MSAETIPAQPVSSSAWLAEQKAAYRRAEEAWADALYRGDDRARDKYKLQMETIQAAIYAERGRSANEKLSHRDEQTEP